MYQTVSELKKVGNIRGIYAVAARKLGLKPDDVRNDYRAEEKLLATRPENSAMAHLGFSNGSPKTKVNINNVIYFCNLYNVLFFI